MALFSRCVSGHQGSCELTSARDRPHEAIEPASRHRIGRVDNGLSARPVAPVVVALPVGIDRQRSQALQQCADRCLAAPEVPVTHTEATDEASQEPALVDVKPAAGVRYRRPERSGGGPWSQPDDGWRRLLTRIERIVIERSPAAVLGPLNRQGEEVEQLRG